MELIFGFCRVSTLRQNIDRQVRNILKKYPSAIIIKEYFTGTKLDGRKEWNKLYNLVKQEVSKGKNVKIVFDEVTRMSRNADEGFKLYQELFELNVELEFLKDSHISTDVYRKSLNIDIQMTGSNVDIILEAVKKYLMALAKEQVKLAFQKSEDEVNYLHKRTSEGLLTAKLNGKQIGRIKGKTYKTKKEITCKEVILKNSKDFNGNNSDDEVMKICGISRNSYYKYKRELKNEL